MDIAHLKAAETKRIAMFRERARLALEREHVEGGESLLELLANSAFKAECKIPPSLTPMFEKGLRDIDDRCQHDFERIHKAVDKLAETISNSARISITTLDHSLREKGVEWEQLSAVLNALIEISEREGGRRRSPGKQGNVASLRSAWVLHLWPFLQGAGLPMKAAARVLAHLFGRSDKDKDTFYQAIRNCQVR